MIPSDKQIEEWNAAIGKPSKNPFTGEIDIIDMPHLSRPTKDTFETSKRICLLYYKFQEELSDKYLNQPLKEISSKEIYQGVVKTTGLPLKEVEYNFRLMNSYFIVGGSWDKEIINLK